MMEQISATMERPREMPNQQFNMANHECHSLGTKATISSQNEAEQESHSFLDRVLLRYAKFIVGYPYANIIIICILFIWAAVIGFVPQLGAQKLPDFTTPTKGFEPRDTQLSNSRYAYDNLKKLYDEGGLFNRPNDKRRASVKLRRSLSALEGSFCYPNTWDSYDISSNKIVYKEENGGNLLNTNNLKDVCTLQNKIMRSNPEYDHIFRRDMGGKMCLHHSIPNYIMLLGNHSSCQHIADSDVSKFQSILKVCAPFYRDGSLKKCLTHSTACNSLVSTCVKYSRVVYNTFQFLSDSNFAKNSDFLYLTIASEQLNDPYDNTFYKSIYDTGLKDLTKNVQGHIQVVAFEFGDLKFSLFEKKLFLEGALLSSAVLIVFILIMIYSRSIFIGLMTFFCIIIATVWAYFCYGIIFRLSFFPFLNVLTLIFLVGIGADDAFVYMGAWKEAMKLIPCDRNNVLTDATLVQWTVYSLKHAIIAMFVTSFTTAAAFFSSASSNIVAIRCFGLFAGTSILMNYLMMVFWFPVAVIISFKYFKECKCSCCLRTVMDPNQQSHNESRIRLALTWLSQRLFQENIPNIVVRLRWVWIVLLTFIGIGGIFVLFVSPKLRLPISKDFQMFSDESSIEQFPLNYKRFFFTDTFSMPVYFVFGVNNANTASMVNPDDTGTLQLNKKMSVTSTAEQRWLKTFCEKLQNSSFTTSLNQGTCHKVISKFQELTMPCNRSSLCCGRTHPLPQADFAQCLTTSLNSSLVFSGFDGLLFDANNQLRAVVIYTNTRFQFSESYDEANEFFSVINSWFIEMKDGAPNSFQSGFWHSYLQFYDLQKSLASGTQISLGISVAIAFGVVLFTTWNFLISIYTIISISFVMSTTIGTLVLAGWRLNIMESIIFSVAAGLAVDFTLHYGVAYRCAPDKSSRAKRVNYSFTHLGSAVAMGAFTTFISGMVMAPSSVLVYIQLSHFLMVLMTFSWTYGNFFFMSLCSALGPRNNFFQLKLVGMFQQHAPHENEHVQTDEHSFETTKA